MSTNWIDNTKEKKVSNTLFMGWIIYSAANKNLKALVVCEWFWVWCEFLLCGVKKNEK